MSDEICELVVTAPEIEWLAGFTRRLVEARLVACGQHITTVRSIYRWEGVVVDDTEARVALHTRVSLVADITARAKEEPHPNKVPCIVALPVIAADPAYLQWVLDETHRG